MPLARRLKRVLGEAADPLPFTKRQPKPRTSLLAVFDAFKSFTKVSKRNIRHKWRKTLSNLLSFIFPTLSLKLKTRVTIIKINTSLL
jgi:hypothetical protein